MDMKKTVMMTILAAMLAWTNASAQFVAGRGYGPGNGAGYQGNGPKDGTGYGAKAGQKKGSGTCDGAGPKGTQRGPQGKGGRR